MRSAARYRIPQTSPGAAYRVHKKALDDAVLRVMNSGRYILGEEVKAFEDEFSHWSGAAHCAGVANGTDALELALRALGVGAGDLVATVSHTAPATAAAVVRAGAVPFFVDVVEDSFTMDPEHLDSALSANRGKIAAVIPVHLYGHPADMPAILAAAHSHSVPVLEDCAQAHGASIKEKRVGTFGIMSAFSFYPTKNLGALGDGGAVLTDDENLADRLRALRQYGWVKGNDSAPGGINSRLDEVQAAILRVKLAHLEEENRRRRDMARQYSDGLADTRFSLPRQAKDVLHAFHQYVVRHPDRNNVIKKLDEAGIGTAIHYPVPVHLQPAFSSCPAADGGLPVTEELCREIISLPIYPQLTDSEVRYIIDSALSSDGT